MRRLAHISVLGILLVMLGLCGAFSAGAEEDGACLLAGFAKRDVSPQDPMPMWGYGARHALLSKGVREPLFAKGVVLGDGATKLALVTMDIGRGPTLAMMTAIRKAVKAASGVDYVMIAGSHTHHGPVIELIDEEGKGKGTYDDAVAYKDWLQEQLIALINEAAGAMQPAKIGWASTELDMNRNRHSKLPEKPIDNELFVIRIDDASGAPIAILANFAAHPTNLPTLDLRFSSEYPGYMQMAVEEAMKTNCMFLQGASGDLSCRKTETTSTIETFGRKLGEEVVKLARGIETKVPGQEVAEGEKPVKMLQVMEDAFAFESRVPLDNPMLQNMFQMAFFPELIAVLDEIDGNTIHAPMSTALIGGELAIVTGPGEFFSHHSVRLKERCWACDALFLGYCNGHFMYFPTVEGAAEGGYGADATVAWVELTAGEQMMDQALVNIYTMLGKYKPPLADLMGN